MTPWGGQQVALGQKWKTRDGVVKVTAIDPETGKVRIDGPLGYAMVEPEQLIQNGELLPPED